MIQEDTLRQAELLGTGSKYKGMLVILGIILVIAWFGLGLYLHVQVVHSREKVAQNRLEAQRKEEFLRRDAQYRQDLERRTQAPRVRNVFDGR